MSLTLVTGPATEPLTVAEAKTHLRIDSADRDSEIEAMIKEVRDHVERVTNRALITQTWEQSFRGFSNVMTLWKAPLQSVTSITYVDDDGATQTLSTDVYQVDTRHTPGRVLLAYGQTWPSVRDQENNVIVQYVAGYATTADVPLSIKRAMKLLLGHYSENAEAVNVGNIINEFPMGVQALLAPYKLLSFE